MENNYCWNLTSSLLGKTISVKNLASLSLGKPFIDRTYTHGFGSGFKQAKIGKRKKWRNFMFEESERPLKGFKKTYTVWRLWSKQFPAMNSGSGSGLDPYSATGWIRIRFQWILIRNTAFTPLLARPTGIHAKDPEFSFLPILRIRIWIRRIHMFFGLLDPDPLVRGMEPSNIKQKY